MGKSILAFITSDKERIVGGDPLTLLSVDDDERRDLTLEFARALKADVVQLRNGDYLVIGNS
jgi:siroheme synthase